MKRSDIRGFTIKFGRYYLEVVTVHHIPRVVTLSRGINLMFRREI